jgi:hypothetical protein
MNSNFHRDCKLHRAAVKILEGEIFLSRTHGERAYFGGKCSWRANERRPPVRSVCRKRTRGRSGTEKCRWSSRESETNRLCIVISFIPSVFCAIKANRIDNCSFVVPFIITYILLITHSENHKSIKALIIYKIYTI